MQQSGACALLMTKDIIYKDIDVHVVAIYATILT